MLHFITWNVLFPWVGPPAARLLIRFGGLNRDAMEMLVVILMPISLCLGRTCAGVKRLPPAGAPGVRPWAALSCGLLFAAGLVAKKKGDILLFLP
jgi:hypothetical protein